MNLRGWMYEILRSSKFVLIEENFLCIFMKKKLEIYLCEFF